MQEASVSPTPPVSAISALQLFSTSNLGTTSALAVSGAFAGAAARARTNIDARIFSLKPIRNRRGEIGIDEDQGAVKRFKLLANRCAADFPTFTTVNRISILASFPPSVRLK
jgi:hypothetical protein